MIKIDREALLKILAAPALTPPYEAPIRCRGEYEYVSIQKPAFEEEYLVEKPQDQDDDSVYTASTASLSCDADDVDYDKQVSFSDSLVTEEWTREYTPKDDVAHLFYSSEEMQRFRQEYRLERKLISDLSINPDKLHTDIELFSQLVDSKRQAGAQGRHQISRVVVLHQNKLETFAVEVFSSDDIQFDLDSFWSGNLAWF